MSTSAQTAAAPQTLQQLVNSINARLAELAKDPPDLMTYLRAHAEAIASVFKPAGFAYEMRNGPAFQRVLQANLESLRLKEFPEQENAFSRALRATADRRKPVMLAPQSETGQHMQGLAVEDSPAPDELPVFNRTDFEQHFFPIPLGNVTAGVLHMWFPPGNAALANVRSAAITQICAAAELYLKSRQMQDVSAEVTRLSTYVRLLEELAGDTDVESVSWNLVNFARETVGCERVCLFVVRHYDRVLVEDPLGTGGDRKFVLQACSGLKKPHPRSEQAVTLQRLAQKLAQMSIVVTPPPGAEAPAPAALPAGGAPAAVNGAANPAQAAVPPNRPAPSPSAPVPPARQRTQVNLMMRDPSKVATRPEEINDYFDLMPMNWATVITLFDRDGGACGILLFEGVKAEERLGALMKPMIDLSAAAGRTLGSTLYFDQHRPMRWARAAIALRERYVNTPVRRRLTSVGLPLLLLAGLLCLPITYHVSGDASVLTVHQSSMPALVGTRLLEVTVHEGEPVRAGQMLARFDTQDLRLQLAAQEQEQTRALLESDNALANNNEFLMRSASLAAEKAGALADKLRGDIDKAEVRAPFDGIVLGAQTLSTRVGEVLRVGETALQVVDPKAWQVKAVLRERDLIYLDERFQAIGPVPATLRLAADPAKKYELALTSRAQLAYGLDMEKGEYQFTAVVPLNTEIDPTLMKSGFNGRISFDGGRKPVAYVLFKDFIQYLKVRFF